MSDWDRIQRLEMDMAQLRARILRMDNLNLHLMDELAQAQRERDTARGIAMRLEEEVVWVSVRGEAT